MTTITLSLPEQTMEQARQAELTHMTWLDNQALWEIARRTMSPEDQASMAELVRQQGERTLTESEQSRLDALRREYGRITLMKARAYALLSLRGGEPLLGQV